jgi:beta-glucanase (GH16 family)
MRVLRRPFPCFVLAVGLGCDQPATDSPPVRTPDPASYELVWSDEFDQDGLPDSARWGYDVGDGCPAICGWGNAELEHYTAGRPENARVENGYLIIEAHRETVGSSQYSSARLVTREKGDWLYGRLVIRARLPTGRGTWPAIWMLPTDWAYGGWPASGEIDILEHVGFNPDSVFGTVHTAAYNHAQGTQRGGSLALPDAETEFHEYAVDWTPGQIVFLVDSVAYFSFANEGTGSAAWPFDRRFHLILNVAVGGTWGGQQGVDDAIWPQRLTVDYVRVYQRSPSP